MGAGGRFTIRAARHPALEVAVVFHEKADPRCAFLIASDANGVGSIVVELLRYLVREAFDL